MKTLAGKLGGEVVMLKVMLCCRDVRLRNRARDVLEKRNFVVTAVSDPDAVLTKGMAGNMAIFIPSKEADEWREFTRREARNVPLNYFGEVFSNKVN